MPFQRCLRATKVLPNGGQHHQDELAKIEEALEALDVVTRRAAKPKAAKIYIREGTNLHSFMWANVGPDGS
jgi:hypothetical protein